MWFSGRNTVGIVQVDGGIKYYIGVVHGHSEEIDIDFIADWGAKFPKEIGDQLFRAKTNPVTNIVYGTWEDCVTVIKKSKQYKKTSLYDEIECEEVAYSEIEEMIREAKSSFYPSVTHPIIKMHKNPESKKWFRLTLTKL